MEATLIIKMKVFDLIFDKTSSESRFYKKNRGSFAEIVMRHWFVNLERQQVF